MNILFLVVLLQVINAVSLVAIAGGVIELVKFLKARG